MNLSKNILHNLNESLLLEKASIDWNNYLTPEEVKQFLSKDDKVESAEEIIYSKEFKSRYNDLHNDLQAKYNNSWNKRELVQDLANFYHNGHLKESIDKLWQSQINQKSPEQLQTYLEKLYIKLYNEDKNKSKIKSNDFYNLLDKINYIEDKLNIKPKLGRELK